MVGSPPVVSRKYLPRSIVAKYAWKLDHSTAAVAALLKSVYGLSAPEESRLVDRVSDMSCAFNPILHELFHDFSVKVHVTGRLIYAVEG